MRLILKFAVVDIKAASRLGQKPSPVNKAPWALTLIVFVVVSWILEHVLLGDGQNLLLLLQNHA
jgi:hypothetical protein